MATQYNIDHAVVKKPSNDVPLTKAQEKLWLKYADDPMAFFTEQCYVRGSRGKVLFQPRNYQSDLLDSVIDNTHVIAVSPRQSGKCSASTTWIEVRIEGVCTKITMGELHELVAKRSLT